MNKECVQDPWQKVTTCMGLAADEVISALQKEIRRGNEENACLLAYDMLLTGPKLEDFLWKRLHVIAVEDIGMADPLAPILISVLNRTSYSMEGHDRKLFAIQAVRYLCSRKKDRSTDELLSWMRRATESGKVKPEIPEYALDKHTRRGLEMGRGDKHFYEVASRVDPEWQDRNRTWRERILKMLDLEEKEN